MPFEINKTGDALDAIKVAICKMVRSVLPGTKNIYIYCLKCHKVDHFAKCCKTKKTKNPQKNPTGSRPTEHKGTVNQVNFEDHPDSDSDHAFTIVDEKQPMVFVNIGGIPNVAMIVDSGASCNVIDRQLWKYLKQNKEKCVSTKHKEQLYPYGSSEPWETAGCFIATVEVGNVAIESEFTVIEGKGQALLGRETATQLNGVRLNERVCINTLKEEDVFEKYKSCFEGLGKLKDFQLNIPIDQNVKPVVQSMRRVPFSLRDKLG